MVAHIEVVARIAAHSMVADRIADCNIVVVRTVVERTADRIGFVVAVAHIVVEHTDFAERTDFVRTVVARTAVERTVVEHTDFAAHTDFVARTAAERTVVAHIVVERTADRIGFVVAVEHTVVAHIAVEHTVAVCTAAVRTAAEHTDFVSIVESPAAVE